MSGRTGRTPFRSWRRSFYGAGHTVYTRRDLGSEKDRPNKESTRASGAALQHECKRLINVARRTSRTAAEGTRKAPDVPTYKRKKKKTNHGRNPLRHSFQCVVQLIHLATRQVQVADVFGNVKRTPTHSSAGNGLARREKGAKTYTKL